MIVPKLSSTLAYGGDYNPEQWPEAVWLEDVELMREAGVNLVTLGVFSWSLLQPSEDRYEFDWLDRIMDLLAHAGIFVDLATATASPPPWLSERYSDVLAIDAQGLPFYPGSRQHYSPCSPSYRKFASALVEKIATRYRSHPALAAWHINNEYGNHVTECHGPQATQAFRHWLKLRYQTIDLLNEAWGTSFWSQRYNKWDEVQTPRRTPTFANPAQQLDYKRFMSDALLDLFIMERDIVRSITPEIPVTTNYMGFHKPVNYQRWSREMDFVSWDSYPDPLMERAAALANAAAHDLTRSLKKDRPFLLMEQSVSSVTWRAINGAKPPGLMRLWSWQALARGADGVMFFQWRASRFGAEKFLGGMVPHVPAARSRIFSEVKALGAELQGLKAIVGSRVVATVAIAFDWEAWWAIEFDSKPAPIAYAAWAQEIHAYFYSNNIAVDFVHPTESLERYRLVIAPALYLLNQAGVDNLTQYVERGGSLLATYFTGIVDEREQVVVGGYPARLRKVLGIWVEEWSPLALDEEHSFQFAEGGFSARCRDWCERVHLEDAQAVAHYRDGHLAHQPAITRNDFGRGAAYYLSTRPDSFALASLLTQICALAKVSMPFSVPAGVEIAVRESDHKHFLFVLNHLDRAIDVTLENGFGIDLVSGQATTGGVTLAPRDAKAFEWHFTESKPSLDPAPRQDLSERSRAPAK